MYTAATGTIPAASSLSTRVRLGFAGVRRKKDRVRKQKTTADQGMKSKTPVSGSTKVRQSRAGSIAKVMSRTEALPTSQWLAEAVASNETPHAAANTRADLRSFRKYSIRIHPTETRMKASDCIAATASSGAESQSHLLRNAQSAVISRRPMKVAGKSW